LVYWNIIKGKRIVGQRPTMAEATNNGGSDQQGRKRPTMAEATNKGGDLAGKERAENAYVLNCI
jgi:hypothetical protein